MLTVIQTIVAIILVILILLQERGGGLGALGGGGVGVPYQTRRGIGKAMFWATIIAAVLFAALSVLNLMY